VVLAYIARHAVNGAIAGARQGYRTIRMEVLGKQFWLGTARAGMTVRF
jgi:hypothetical protein